MAFSSDGTISISSTTFDPGFCYIRKRTFKGAHGLRCHLNKKKCVVLSAAVHILHQPADVASLLSLIGDYQKNYFCIETNTTSGPSGSFYRFERCDFKYFQARLLFVGPTEIIFFAYEVLRASNPSKRNGFFGYPCQETASRFQGWMNWSDTVRSKKEQAVNITTWRDPCPQR